jgi:predicted esterase
MTRQDRELAMTDNLMYMERCLAAAEQEFATVPRVVFAGFSQGVAMAFRAAVKQTRRVAGVAAVGGDVPPELTGAELGRLSGVAIVRGIGDSWYTGEKFAEDKRRVAEAGVQVRALEFDGGHEWTEEVGQFMGKFLADEKLR